MTFALVPLSVQKFPEEVLALVRQACEAGTPHTPAGPAATDPFAAVEYV
jgi:hypothetical protein